MTPSALPATQAVVSIRCELTATGRGRLLMPEEQKSKRGQFLCYSSSGKPLWISARSALTLLCLWLLQTVCLCLSPSQRHVCGGSRARDDHTRARASEEDRGQHCPWQGIAWDRSVPRPALHFSVMLYLGQAQPQPVLGSALVPLMGAWGWGCFCPPSPYQVFSADLPCSDPICFFLPTGLG